MLNNRMQNLDAKKEISISKGDLGHLDTTKKTSRYQKRMHPLCSGFQDEAGEIRRLQ